jgi:hypothetical protein
MTKPRPFCAGIQNLAREYRRARVSHDHPRSIGGDEFGDGKHAGDEAWLAWLKHGVHAVHVVFGIVGAGVLHGCLS